MNGKRSVFFEWQSAAVFFLILLMVPVSGKAQVPVPVTISGEKMVVEGKVFYMHQVMKGQTLYSIARAYAVSVDVLSRENNLTENAIKEGQVLRIPAAASDQGRAAMNSSQASSQPGSTGQSGQIVQPGKGVAAGSTATVAESRTQAPGTPANQDERYIYHRVRRGETLGTIADEYGISVRDLKRANRGLLFPHEGDYLLIPRNKISDPDARRRADEVREEVVADTVITDTTDIAEEPEVFTVLSDRSTIERLTGSVRVAVLFPFFIKENSVRTYIDSTGRDSRGNTVYREVTRTSSDIYQGSLPFLEAYEGLLIAVDSLRSLGLNVELEVYDTGADSSEMKRLLRTGFLEDADLIIGPVFSHNLEQISGWAADRDIPIVSPVALRDAHIHENKPYLYRVFPSQNVAQDFIAREVGSHPESNVIFLYADSAMYDPATVMLWEKVRMAAGSSQYDTAGVIPFYFTGTTAKRDEYSTVASIESLLDPDRENIFVIASTSTPVVSSVFSSIHSLTKRYDIKVIGYPEIRGLETIDLKYYYDLELLIPTESFIDFESPAVQAFTATFRRKFRTEPMAESFAWRGFDIAWYFIGGIATGGEEFIRDPGTFNPALLCLEPDFRRDSRLDGYENRGMFILHYHKDMTIEIRRPWRAPDSSDNKNNDPFSSPFSGSSGRNRVR
ncbi:MAG: LysM peptidoglycan-binding domain-containing protein [Bacteroidales bacterium]|jgi:LysM repeat protein|nr:LysM peptidoglycan-binding domain-containing protein [Bacteroidales bacterium]